MATPLNIIGGWYSDVAKPWTQQDICNYIPFVAEQPGPITQIEAVDAPGLKPFVEIASDGGIRGAKNVEGKLLVVASTTLYQISNTGVAIPRGAIPGTGLVSIDYNQQGIANQVLIGNGSAGYVYDTALLTLERITDPAFPGTKAVAYLDSYLLGVEPLGRYWFHSNLADATDYNSLDRYEAETAPDRIVTLAVSNEEVVVFGQTTTDFFVNTGATTGTFQSKGVSMDVGCASAASVVKLDNTLFWLDNYGVFQRLNGYSPQPVSTRVLESAIAGFDWSKCRATVYQDRGRKIVYWTFPNGLTLGYDVTTGLWHRREAYGLLTDRISTITFWNRKWIAGDVASGRLYELDWDYMLQVDQPHVRKLKTAPLTANRNRLALHRAELVFDTGGPATVAIPFPEQPTGPQISGNAPNGVVGVEYPGYTYTVVAGDAPIQSVQIRPGGSLPTGLGPLSNAGVIPAGDTPTAAGISSIVVRATDTNGLWAEVEDTIVISEFGVEGLFETVLYTGTGTATRSITSLDLSEGGIAWIKKRTSVEDHHFVYSEDGSSTNVLITNSTSLPSAAPVDFTELGFDLTASDYNTLDEDYVAWVFRKGSRFLDIVPYDGTGAPQTLSHSLGVAPGLIIVKKVSGVGLSEVNWQCYHRDVGNTGAIPLNNTGLIDTNTRWWNDTSPTTTHFTIGAGLDSNNIAGDSYVAFLFAHDGADDGVIRTFTSTGGLTGNEISTAGIDAQFLLFYYDAAYVRSIFDSTRTPDFVGDTDLLEAGSNAAESSPFNLFDRISGGLHFNVTGNLPNINTVVNYGLAIRVPEVVSE